MIHHAWQHNPLVVASYDVVWLIFAGLTLMAGVLAAISVIRTNRFLQRDDRTALSSLTAGAQILWVAGVLMIPVVGPGAWFVVGRPDLLRRVRISLESQRSDYLMQV